MALFIDNHPNRAFLFHRLWILNKHLVIALLVDQFHADRVSISRILDIAQELKVRCSAWPAHRFICSFSRSRNTNSLDMNAE